MEAAVGNQKDLSLGRAIRKATDIGQQVFGPGNVEFAAG
jgi:hypothetical protein